MDLVMVTAPNPPGSRQLISPFIAVFEMAPAKVLQGAVRLQGLTSSPTPETQVRDAWAKAGEPIRQVKSIIPAMADINFRICIVSFFRRDRYSRIRLKVPN